MELIDKIAQLRKDSLVSLNASHDYHVHTKLMWRLTQNTIRQGHKFTSRNLVTNNKIDETLLSGLAQEYVRSYLSFATFQHFVSLFETFVFGFIRVWLEEYPKSLKEMPLDFQTVLDSADKSTIISTVVERKILKVSYKRLDDWFKYLKSIVNIDCPDENQIKRLAEIKASRDVIVHNNRIVNTIYISKSMGCARFKDGDSLELPEKYHRESWQLIQTVVSDISDTATEKFRK